MEDLYVLVAEREGADPLEVDAIEGVISLSTLRSQFGPDAAGLQYRNIATNRWRAVAVDAETLRPPAGGWMDRIYILKRFAPHMAAEKTDSEFINVANFTPSERLTGASPNPLFSR